MMNELLTPREMAEILRTPLSWIYGQTRLKGENTIPTVRVGKYIRFKKNEVLSWLEQQAN